MRQLIAYVHFLGFLPALSSTTGDLDGADVILSAIFSWGAVIARIVATQMV